MVLGAHPKQTLYEKVYVPLTVRWFETLESRAGTDLLTTAARPSLSELLLAFNDSCREPIGRLLDDEMVRTAVELHEAILWMGDETPGPHPTPAQIRVRLTAKLRRNISLGVLEAVLCLESAYQFAKDHLRLRGDDLSRVLRESRQLYASLAVLHDQQECERLSFLTGREGYLEYPAVDYPDVVTGRVRIPAGRFAVSGQGDGVRIRFVSHPVQRVDPISGGPTMRCPAHQPVSGRSYNDTLWDCLIDIYRQAGRFDGPPVGSGRA